MTHLTDGTIVTDLGADADNAALLAQGYSIRHVETWHGHGEQSFIRWDAPEITEADLGSEQEPGPARKGRPSRFGLLAPLLAWSVARATAAPAAFPQARIFQAAPARRS